MPLDYKYKERAAPLDNTNKRKTITNFKKYAPFANNWLILCLKLIGFFKKVKK